MIEKRISFKLDPGDIFIYDNSLLKTASVNLPDNIPYDPNFLYVEVRAVSAGEYYGNNKNVDYFPEAELNPPKKNAGYGKETFMTAHVFKNHDNKDVANAIGDVLRVYWDDEMKGVNLLLRIDKVTSPSVVRGFEAGYITDVSMGCRVHHVVCSICGHNARTKADYCNHLKTEKGKIYPDGKKVQEINIQPKFHDISVVLNGAEKIAKVMKIYRDDSAKREKTASLTSEDMTRIALDLGMSKHASADELGGMLKLAGFEDDLTVDTLTSHDTVRSFFASYIENANRQNIEKLAIEQEFDKFDPKKQAFRKLATIQKLSEFEKRIEGEIIRTSAQDVEDKMKAEVEADDAFTDALQVAKARSFQEMDDEAMDEIAKKLLAISGEKRIPRFEILRTFFTILATKGINLTLTEFSHLTMHVLKGMAFEGDHDVFERKINDYRAHLTELIMADIRRQEVAPGTGLFNVQNAIANQASPLGMHGLDKMIMALSGAAPFGVRAVVRRPMMKIASYQEGACSPAGIMGSDMTNEVIFTLEAMVDECLPLVDRNKPIMSYAADLMEIAEMEKTAAWLVNKEKKQRVRDMKFLGHNLERAKQDAQLYKSKADLLRPEVDILSRNKERAQKQYSAALDEKYKQLELKKQLNPTMYDKDLKAESRAYLHAQMDGPEWDKLREAEREYSKADMKFYDHHSDAKRHQENAKKIEQDIKSQAKEYGDNFFGPNPQRKKELQRKEHLIVGAGIGTAAALGGGAYLYHRYKKKKREQEQEKTALLSDPDNLWKDQNKPPTLLNALKPKKPHSTTAPTPDYVKGTGKKQPSLLTDLMNNRKRY